jgi:hypothetical protein
MKGKLVLTLGFAGVLALSIGFTKDFPSTKVSAEELQLEEVTSKQKDMLTVITVEEQNMVEIMPIKEGYISREDGTGFYFSKNYGYQRSIAKEAAGLGFIPNFKGSINLLPLD